MAIIITIKLIPTKRVYLRHRPKFLSVKSKRFIFFKFQFMGNFALLLGYVYGFAVCVIKFAPKMKRCLGRKRSCWWFSISHESLWVILCICVSTVYFILMCLLSFVNIPDSKIGGANIEPIWGRQDPGGPTLAPWTLLSRIQCVLYHFSKSKVRYIHANPPNIVWVHKIPHSVWISCEMCCYV